MCTNGVMVVLLWLDSKRCCPRGIDRCCVDRGVLLSDRFDDLDNEECFPCVGSVNFSVKESTPKIAEVKKAKSKGTQT